MSQAFKLACMVSLAFVALGIARAQIETGTIVGVVQDGSGAAVPNATVTLTQVATGVARRTSTNDQGAFNAQFMALGTYAITATAQSFQTKTLSGITLQVDQTVNLTIVLAVGTVSQSVEVTSAAPLLDTTTSSVGQVIDNQEVLSMPLNGRNAFALGLLVGNTVPVSGMGTNLPFAGGSGRFSSEDVSLSGIDDNTFSTAGSVGRQGYAFVPSVDAVEEFKVITNNFAAEYGHAAGTITSATLKAGTNQFHGVAFEFVRNDIFDANNFFTNRAGLPRTPFHQNQFGGAIGGPVLRNRVFFFTDYQGTRETTQNGSSIESLPPAAFRTGDFSSSSTLIFDPRTRHIGPNGTVVATSFLAETGANKIPSSLISSTATAIVNALPSTNYGAAGAVANNYFYAPHTFSDTDQGDIRMDVTISQKNHLTSTYSMSNNHTPAVGVIPGNLGGGSPAEDDNDQITLSDVHIFSQNWVNNLRAGWLFNNGSQSGSGQAGAGFAAQAGLALFPSNPLGFPAFDFSASGSSSSSSSEFTTFGGGDPDINALTTRQLADDLSWIHGRHSVKLGVDIRETLFTTLRGDPFFGEFVFGPTFSSSSDTASSGLPFADFLMGYPTFTDGSPMINKGRQRNAYAGEYIQDDWKTSSKLTLNVGLRYELYTQPIDQNNLGSLFDLTTGNFAIPGNTPYTRAMVQGDHNDWGPRFGFSYQSPLPKLVVRGGYGVFYAMRDQNQSATQFSGSTPNIPTIQVPSISPATTVAPPYTMNTPIHIVPATASTAGFTPAAPYGVVIKTQGLQSAQMPRLMQYNLDLEYQQSPNRLFAISYSGSRGRHFTTFYIDQNQEPFSDVLNGTNTQANRPYPNMGANVEGLYSRSSQHYNALNVKVQQQASHGLQFLANYSWQKNIESMGNGPDAYSESSSSVAMYTYNLADEKGVTPLNIAQIASGSVLYQLPFGAGRPLLSAAHGLLEYAVGGWVVNGIISLRTGFPSSVETNAVPADFQSFNFASCVPGVATRLLNPGVDGYFNPAAFTVPAAATTITGAQVPTIGNCGHFPITGPSARNLDSSVFKNFYFGESHLRYLEFRVEAFNTTNTPTFNLPSSSSTSLTCEGPAGAICNATNSSFGKLTSASATGRQVQFAGKLYF